MNPNVNYDFDNENNIGHKIILVSKTIQNAFDLELHDKVGITMAQWRAINILTTQNGITQREIADKLGLDTSSLIPLIDRLESKGLVNRRPDNADRRINRLFITKKTESLLGQMQSCANLFKRSLREGIHKDQLETTLLVLDRISQNLSSQYGINSDDINSIIVKSRIVNSSSKSGIV
jgi:MarR family transcriptional regulator for hemolysin